MTTDNTTALKSLETLTDTAIDSCKGYKECAEKANSPALKKTLMDQATRRQKTVDNLTNEVRRLGGDLETRGTVTGDLHRMWTKVSDLFEDGDEAATERVEEGEDYIEKKFREALDATDFSPETRAVVQAAHAEISEGEKLTDRLEAQYDD